MRALGVLALAMWTAPAWASPPGPVQRTEALLTALQAEDGREVVLTRFVDRESMVNAVVEPLRPRLTTQQYQRTRQVFWQLVQVLVCPDLLTGAQWRVLTPPKSSTEVSVLARKIHEDWQSELTLDRKSTRLNSSHT